MQKHIKMVLNHVDYLLSKQDYEQVEYLLEVEYTTTEYNQYIGLKLANFYQSRSQLKEAQYIFGEVCENTPGIKEAMLGYGRSYRLIGKYKSSRDFFLSFLKTFNEDPKAELELAESLLLMNSIEEAIVLIEKNKNIVEEKGKITFLKGLLLNKKGHYIASINTLKNKYVETDLIIIDSHFRLENFKECFQLVNNLIQNHSNHPIVRYWKCIELIHSNDLEQAMKLALQVREDYKSISCIQSLIGDIKFAEGDLKAANRYYISIPIAAPWNSEAISKYYYLKAKDELSEFDKDKLIEFSEDSKSIFASFYTGMYFLDIQNDAKNAAMYFKKSISKLPEHVPSIRKLAEVSKQLGKLDEHTKLCKSIITLNPLHEWAKSELNNK